jgi:hypothetical protein
MGAMTQICVARYYDTIRRFECITNTSIVLQSICLKPIVKLQVGSSCKCDTQCLLTKMYTKPTYYTSFAKRASGIGEVCTSDCSA